MIRCGKKPVVVETVQLVNDENTIDALKEFCRGRIEIHQTARDVTATVRSLEGLFTAVQGDYIIKDVKGEFYPCNPRIFEKTYEVLPS